MIRNQDGMGLLHFVTAIAILSLAVQLYLIQEVRYQNDVARRFHLREMKSQMINNMLEIARDELTLRNSRLNVNDIIVKCLGGHPDCLETELYDLVIFSPTPPFIFTGEWPAPPATLQRLLGGFTNNKKFYNPAGGPCADTTTDLSIVCPLQAIARIRPLCGGTDNAPTYSVPGGGPCLTPATGFEIVIGVASFWRGERYFNERVDEGDQRSFIVSSRTFLN